MENSSIPILNIAGYHFFDLPKPEELRLQLKEFCLNQDLKGTVLLSTEGVNIFVAGLPVNISHFKSFLIQDLKFPAISFRESWSQERPYNRMLVRLKKEIISMGVKDVRPQNFTSPYIEPKELHQWLKSGKDILLLDTRNDFEIKLGKFSGAQDLNVNSFREFARLAKNAPKDWRKKPLVMYCTGGIRCEKASALFLKKYGFKEVYQLAGGIINYFQHCGNDYFDGECFVFDKRVCLDGDLNETPTQQCFNCRAVVALENLSHPDYQPPNSCPQCIPRN